MPPKKKTTEQTIGMTEFTPVISNDETKKDKKDKGVILKTGQSDSDRLLLAQSIHNLVAKGDAFVSALDTLQQFSKEKLLELDILIETKKKEYTDLHVNLQNQYKDTEIKMKQNLEEYKMSSVKEILESLGMMSIKVSEYNELTADANIQKQKHIEELNKMISEERERGQNALKQAMTNSELSHKAEIATLKAQNEQQMKEIAVLKDTITGLKHELSEQRSLTKSVAEASSKAQISQNFGNK